MIDVYAHYWRYDCCGRCVLLGELLVVVKAVVMVVVVDGMLLPMLLISFTAEPCTMYIAVHK